MLRGGSYLFSQRYKEAIAEFNHCMTLREAGKTFSEDDEQDADEVEEISAYLNHMRFNIALCYIMMQEWQKAKDMCNKCTIQKEKTTLQLLICAIKNEMGESI